MDRGRQGGTLPRHTLQPIPITLASNIRSLRKFNSRLYDSSMANDDKSDKRNKIGIDLPTTKATNQIQISSFLMLWYARFR
ncbi:unnamed protein product [Lathyrus sativus]|nr:unnamed protein product [Lathyrus sativus]